MRYPFLMLAIGLVTCGRSTLTGPGVTGSAGGGSAKLRVVNAVADSQGIDVLVSGRAVITSLGPGQVSAITSVSSGTRQLAFRLTGGTTGPATSLFLAAGDTTTVLAVDSSSVIGPLVLPDSGAAVAPGASRLRVVHAAGKAPNLLAWYTQPTFTAYVALQTPFPLKTVSQYLESVAGDWQVLAATEAYNNSLPVVTDTLALSNPITIPSAESRTVVLMDDGAGGVALLVIQP